MARKTLDAVLQKLRRENPKGFNRALFLDSLRLMLRKSRGELSQATIAGRCQREQSEISRTENGLTNFTRIGSILDYIDACEVRIVMAAYDSAGQRIAIADSSGRVQDEPLFEELSDELELEEDEAAVEAKTFAR